MDKATAETWPTQKEFFKFLGRQSVMKVYAALYCPCKEESGFVIISLHLSEQGAKKAIRNSRRRCLREFKSSHYEGRLIKFGEFEDWAVTMYEVKP